MQDPVISPTPLPPPEAVAMPRPAGGPARQRRRLLAAFGVVALLALLVSFALPHMMARDALRSGSEESVEPPAEPPDPILSEEEKAAARLDAQDSLAEVLTAMEAISARDVTSWNSAGWQAVQALVAAGEKAYRQQRYPAAIRTYREALQAIEALNAELPTVVAAARADADAALARRDGPVASIALERLLRLAPGDPDGLRALDRARNLERADALLAQAAGYERLGDTAQAKAAFEAVLALDPQEPSARKALARLAGNASLAAFEAAMSEGHAALAGGSFDTAVAAFERARKLQPDNPETGRALAQARERQAAARLERALANAARMETSERWDEAAAALADALAVDREMDNLRPRLARARARAALSAALEQALSNPDVLGDGAARTRAEAALARARAVPAPGPRLARQIRTLQRALADAREPAPAH